MIRRIAILAYGVVCYVLFLAVFLYLAAFIGGIGVPTRLDGPRTVPWAQALATNASLILLFGLQHSFMARPAFKRWWTQWIPVAAERSTYVLATNAALALLFWQWQPLGGIVWNLQSPVARAACWGLWAVGWATVLWSTFLIHHFDLFGLRQVWLQFRQQPYTHLPFKTPGLYRWVRHPLYVGWLLAFWATPTMSVSHLLFSVALTAYILMAIPLEERNLMEHHSKYAEYRKRVGMLIPRWPRRNRSDIPSAALPKKVGHSAPAEVDGQQSLASLIETRSH